MVQGQRQAAREKGLDLSPREEQQHAKREMRVRLGTVSPRRKSFLLTGGAVGTGALPPHLGVNQAFRPQYGCQGANVDLWTN